jgi:hypothetical protein
MFLPGSKPRFSEGMQEAERCFGSTGSARRKGICEHLGEGEILGVEWMKLKVVLDQ